MTQYDTTTTDIPQELRDRRIWLMWDAASDTPRRPHWRGDYSISWSDPDAWHSYEEAVEYASEKESWGVGYVNSKANPDHPQGLIATIDTDGCLTDDGEPKEWVPSLQPFIENNVYIERSPSGNGLHIPLLGYDAPEWWRDIHFSPDEHEGVELLENKFCTCTGDRLFGGGTQVATDQKTIGKWMFQAKKEIEDDASDAPTHTDQDPDGYTWNEETVRDALNHINPDKNYTDWRNIGYAVCNALDGAPGWEHVFKEWSKRGTKWDREAEYIIEWMGDNANPNGGVTPGTLVHHAQQGGWTPPWNKDTQITATEPNAVTSGDETNTDDNPINELHHWLESLDNKPHKGEKTQKAATTILKHIRILTEEETDEIWRYHPDEGTWKKDGENHIRRILDRGLGTEYSTRVHNETVSRIQSRTTIPRQEFQLPRNKIPVQNGLLDLETKELEPLQPDDHAKYKLPVEYDAEAECPRFKEYLKTVTRGGGDRKKLQEYVGYVFMHGGMPHHKALFLAGPEASGKSTFIDVVSSLYPTDVVGGSTPHQLTRRFGKACLYNLWLNVSADIPNSMIDNTGTFKMITGKDVVDAELKGVQEKLTFTPTTKHIFSANQLPEVYEADDAFWRRVLLVPFPETIPRDDRVDDLDEKLIDQEAPGILNWALEGYDRLKEQNEFTADRTPKETRKKWMMWSTSVVRFYARCLRDDIDNSIPKRETYRAYKRFCDASDLSPIDYTTFGEKIKRFPHIGDDTHPTSKQSSYTNVTFAPNLPYTD